MFWWIDWTSSLTTCEPLTNEPSLCAQRAGGPPGMCYAGNVYNGIDTAAVFSSQWCRCLDTARALALGEITPFAGLNSFFADRGDEAQHTRAARALIAEQARGQYPLVLVTHQVNITALAGVFPAAGEIIVMRIDGDALSLAGRIGTAP